MGPECHSPIKTTSTRLLTERKNAFALNCNHSGEVQFSLLNFCIGLARRCSNEGCFFLQIGNFRLDLRPARVRASIPVLTERASRVVDPRFLFADENLVALEAAFRTIAAGL
jgi:hypothetical protein